MQYIITTRYGQVEVNSYEELIDCLFPHGQLDRRVWKLCENDDEFYKAIDGYDSHLGDLLRKAVAEISKLIRCPSEIYIAPLLLEQYSPKSITYVDTLCGAVSGDQAEMECLAQWFAPDGDHKPFDAFVKDTEESTYWQNASNAGRAKFNSEDAPLPKVQSLDNQVATLKERYNACRELLGRIQVDNIQVLREKARDCNADAEYDLGVRYELGDGIPQSHYMATIWMAESIRHGNSKAHDWMVKNDLVEYIKVLMDRTFMEYTPFYTCYSTSLEKINKMRGALSVPNNQPAIALYVNSGFFENGEHGFLITASSIFYNDKGWPSAKGASKGFVPWDALDKVRYRGNVFYFNENPCTLDSENDEVVQLANRLGGKNLGLSKGALDDINWCVHNGELRYDYMHLDVSPVKEQESSQLEDWITEHFSAKDYFFSSGWSDLLGNALSPKHLDWDSLSAEEKCYWVAYLRSRLHQSEEEGDTVRIDMNV